MLIIKRCNHSFKASKHLFEHSQSKIFECLLYFFYNLFCSCCCSKKLDDNPSFFVVNTSDSNEQTFKDSQSTTKSTTDSLTMLVQLNEAFCWIPCIKSHENKSLELTRNQLKASSIKLKRSASFDSYKSKKEENFFHKNMRRRHNKVQKNSKLIDLRVVRYGTAHFAQRILDVFLLIWFICGNYWTFSVNTDEVGFKILNRNVNQTNNKEQYSPKLKASNLEKNRFLTQLVNITEKQIESELSYLNKNSDFAQGIQCDPICYQSAFIQIIITYSFFFICFLFVILFRIYSLKPKNIKSVYTRKRSYSLP